MALVKLFWGRYHMGLFNCHLRENDAIIHFGSPHFHTFSPIAITQAQRWRHSQVHFFQRHFGLGRKRLGSHQSWETFPLCQVYRLPCRVCSDFLYAKMRMYPRKRGSAAEYLNGLIVATTEKVYKYMFVQINIDNSTCNTLHNCIQYAEMFKMIVA